MDHKDHKDPQALWEPLVSKEIQGLRDLWVQREQVLRDQQVLKGHKVQPDL